MAKTSSVEIDTKRLDQILKRMPGNVGDAVKKAALMVEAQAKINAPVDTGALRASIYTSMKGGSGSGAMAQASSLNPDAMVEALPVPDSPTVAYVGPSVEYGAGVELGTTRRPGTPYLQPAVRSVEREFARMVGEAAVDK